ncbi:LuxR C-terminal-related transcriptional regulator [Eubacteriaceae bacterium ES3]|nr:LuxR C-terminal-related transcriptional regulator [Eubacteriaceae bacterium ES3]
MDEDHLLWIINGKESNLVRESDLMAEESRLTSSLYLNCYQQYNIFDTLQFSIVYNQHLLGILTLFRTRADGEFNEDDMFYLRSLGIHLNMIMNTILLEEKPAVKFNLEDLVNEYHLTSRESQVLNLVAAFRNNDEIGSELSISENTIQKHLQNIFRKLNVSSKWDLLRLL